MNCANVGTLSPLARRLVWLRSSAEGNCWVSASCQTAVSVLHQHDAFQGSLIHTMSQCSSICLVWVVCSSLWAADTRAAKRGGAAHADPGRTAEANLQPDWRTGAAIPKGRCTCRSALCPDFERLSAPIMQSQLVPTAFACLGCHWQRDIDLLQAPGASGRSPPQPHSQICCRSPMSASQRQITGSSMCTAAQRPSGFGQRPSEP